MWEHRNPLVQIIQCELVFAHLAFVTDGTVAPKLPILSLLQEPAALSVLDLGGQVRDVHRVLSHLQSLCRQLLQRQIGKGAVFRPQHMDLDHLAILDLRPLAHQLKPPRIQLQILRALRFFEVLSEVLVADGHLLQGVLGPGPVVVELEEDGSPGLGQQVVRASRVLAHLEDDVALKCIIRAYSCK